METHRTPSNTAHKKSGLPATAKSMVAKHRKFLIVAAAFCLVGSTLLARSHAATFVAAVEAEAGQRSGNFGAGPTAGASGGASVNFGKTSTGGGGGGGAGCPAAGSGEALPQDNVPNFKLIYTSDFCKDAATGSWNSTDSGAVGYTDSNGSKWVSYPTNFYDTYEHRPYRSDQVLSVHDGALDFFLHSVDGQPAGANPSPLITGSSQYQTYGRYVARFKVDPGLSEYYAAWLLWPSGDGNGSCAESDFPEGHLSDSVGGFAHHCGGQDEINGGGAKFSDWHTYAQDWSPGSRKYYIDGKLIGTSTNQIWDSEERWQLQTETNGSGNHSGHLMLDWVAVYSYKP